MVETPGWQLWHALAGLAVPAATSAPPMKHSLTQVPVEHTCPEPQLVPSALLVVVQAPVPSHEEVA